MNLNKETVTFRKTMARDIVALMGLLNKVGLNYMDGGLNSAISKLNQENYIPGNKEFRPSPNFWGYDCNNISFTLERVPDGVKPEITSLNIELRITIIASYSIKPEVVQIHLLENNIIVKGFERDNEYKCTFHLDKHFGQEAEYPHPTYHLHFGGKEMNVDINNYNYGNLLLLDSPRIAHFPMDLFLSIDFILSNFMPDKWRILRLEGEYINLYKKYQKYLWRPYICSLAKHWDDIHEETNIMRSVDLVPQLVPCRES